MSNKMREFLRPIIFFMTLCTTATTFAQAPIADLQASYDYLVNAHSNGGALYSGTAGELSGKFLPLSYFDTPEFWGNYVCNLPGINCNVVDVYNEFDYTLTPVAGAAGDLQTERVNVHNGADIYDAATWQIAIELGAINHHFTNPTGQNAYALVTNQNSLLKLGYDGNADMPFPNDNRGTTKKETYQYNGHSFSGTHAYHYRMITRNWLSTDPLMNSDYTGYISSTHLPEDNLQYQTGKITWTDWKPITGENAWAFLVGPLQASYLNFVKDKQKKYVPFNDLSVQNALAILPAFAAMQSSVGGIYYVPSNTLGNQGSDPVNPYMISVENNFSLYAGLNILKETLLAESKYETGLPDKAKDQIHSALITIDTLLNGGPKTQGLLSFFKKYAWKDGAFIQGGLANDPKQSSEWVPALEPRAVDVNTWGIAALGPKLVDSWFGPGASYNAWQKVKSWGAYGKGSTLWGVGYSDRDGNGQENGHYKQGILSAEWTAGAINMVRSMSHYYQSIEGSAAKKYVASLQSEESSMVTHVQTLRVNQYKNAHFPGKPGNYSKLLSSENYQPYLYSSKRYMIPFGWYANPIPSTCSTAWMLMIADHFNPFVYGG